MNKRELQEFSELEELLWRAEAAAREEPVEEPPEDDAEFDLDFEEEPEDPALYRNYANGYAEPAPEIFDYDEFEDDWEEDYEEEPPIEEPYMPPKPKTQPRSVAERSVSKKPKKRRKHKFLKKLLILLLILVVGFSLLFQQPKSEDSIGRRKFDTATILVCGTDADGTRTDTMMLLYLSGSERRAGLLSLPRDSYTITASGSAAKLNSAYGRNGCGEEGMEVLMDYVQRIIGYRPDGYILVDFTLVPQIVDIMGGVDVEVPMDMEVDGVSLKAGYQHLSGQEVLTILRFRKGYATADLGRIEVQRAVLEACMSQWLTLDHLSSAGEALSMLESASLSSLSTRNYLWMGKALLLGMGNFESDTLPGTAEYRSDVSYYILNRSAIAELINESYNPYKVTITEEDLTIAN